MPFTTLPPAGAKLPASTLFSAINELRPVEGRKTSNETRTSTAVEASDAQVRVALPANTEWELALLLLVNSAANAAGDFSFHLEAPAGASLQIGAHGLDPALPSGTIASLTARASTTTPTASFAIGTSTTATSILAFARVTMGATAGDVILFWAQQTSNVNATSLLSGSRIIARRLS